MFDALLRKLKLVKGQKQEGEQEQDVTRKQRTENKLELLFQDTVSLDKKIQLLNKVIGDANQLAALKEYFYSNPQPVVKLWTDVINNAIQNGKKDLWNKYVYFFEATLGVEPEFLVTVLTPKQILWKFASYNVLLKNEISASWDVKKYFLTFFTQKPELFDMLLEGYDDEARCEIVKQIVDTLFAYFGTEGRELIGKLIRNSRFITPDKLCRYYVSKKYNTSILEELFTGKELKLKKTELTLHEKTVDEEMKQKTYVLPTYILQTFLGIPEAEQIISRLLLFFKSILTGEQTNDKITGFGVHLHEKLQSDGDIPVADIAKVLKRFGLLPASLQKQTPLSEDSADSWTGEELYAFVGQLSLVVHSWLDLSKKYREKGIKLFPYKLGVQKPNQVYDGFSKGFAFVLYLPDILPANVSWKILSQLHSAFPHAREKRSVPGLGQVEVPVIGWVRILPYYIKKIDYETTESKYIWLINEIQSDLLQNTHDLPKKFPDAPEGMRGTLENMFKDYPKVFMNIVIKKAKRAGVSEIWIPTSGELKRCWSVGGEKVLQLFQRVYDGLADFYGAKLIDVKKEHGKEVIGDFGNSSKGIRQVWVLDVNQAMSKVAMTVLDNEDERMEEDFSKTEELFSCKKAQLTEEPDFRDNSVLIQQVMSYIETYVKTWFRQMRGQIGEDYAGFSDEELVRDGLISAIQMLSEGALPAIPENLRSEEEFYVYVLNKLREKHFEYPEDVESVVGQALSTFTSQVTPTTRQIELLREDVIELGPERENEILDKLVELTKKKREQGLTEEEEMWYELYTSLLHGRKAQFDDATRNQDVLQYVSVVAAAVAAFITTYTQVIESAQEQDELNQRFSHEELINYAFTEFIKRVRGGEILVLPYFLMDNKRFFKEVLKYLETEYSFPLKESSVDDAFVVSFEYPIER